jgi:hypothetical protein
VEPFGLDRTDVKMSSRDGMSINKVMCAKTVLMKELLAKRRHPIDSMPLDMVIELKNRAILENGKHEFEMWSVKWQPEKTLAKCKARLAAKI